MIIFDMNRARHIKHSGENDFCISPSRLRCSTKPCEVKWFRLDTERWVEKKWMKESLIRNISIIFFGNTNTLHWNRKKIINKNNKYFHYKKPRIQINLRNYYKWFEIAFKRVHYTYDSLKRYSKIKSRVNFFINYISWIVSTKV